MLIGRAPGFAPGPAVVGPWRPVRLERRRALAVERARAAAAGRRRATGVLAVARAAARARRAGPERLRRARRRPDAARSAPSSSSSGPAARRAASCVIPASRCGGRTRTASRRSTTVEAARRGRGGSSRSTPGASASARSSGGERARGATGWRCASTASPVFARGARLDAARGRRPARRRATALRAAARGRARRRHEHAADPRDRLPTSRPRSTTSATSSGSSSGRTSCSPTSTTPSATPAFMAAVAREARQRARPARRPAEPGRAVRLQRGRPAGRDARARPAARATARCSASCCPRLVARPASTPSTCPSAPWGGDLPFRPDRGVANYYGVGAYLRPLEDARRAERALRRRVPRLRERARRRRRSTSSAAPAACRRRTTRAGRPACRATPAPAGTSTTSATTTSRRCSASTRSQLRAIDHERYLELSRAVTGEVMAEVVRRVAPRRLALRRRARPVAARPAARAPAGGCSTTAASPKAAYHHLRRALAPVAVWSTDEGLSAASPSHVANDRPSALSARAARRALPRPRGARRARPSRELELAAPHELSSYGVEALLGRFVDVSWAYRFGPPAQDVVALSLEDADGRAAVAVVPPSRSGARSSASRRCGSGSPRASHRRRETCSTCIRSERFAYGVRVQRSDGFEPSDDAFSVEPGGRRRIELIAHRRRHRRACGHAHRAQPDRPRADHDSQRPM